MRTHKGSCGHGSVRHRDHGRRVHYRWHWRAALIPAYHQQEANDTAYRLSFPSTPPAGSDAYRLSRRGGLAESANAPSLGWFVQVRRRMAVLERSYDSDGHGRL